MDRISVSSSNVASVGYDSETLTLEVQFNHGGVYQYYEVPVHIYDELIASSSVGTYLNQNIKDVYGFSKT